MSKYKVYAIQGVQFNTLVIEASSKEEAIAQYNKLWDGTQVYSVDYRDDKVEYVVEQVRDVKFTIHSIGREQPTEIVAATHEEALQKLEEFLKGAAHDPDKKTV